MKIWEFFTIYNCEGLFYDENRMTEIFKKDKWHHYYQWYLKFDELVDKQDREKLDHELPEEFCIEAFSMSQRKYYLVENKVLNTCYEGFPIPTKEFKILSALEVYKIYGGACMVVVMEKINYHIDRYSKI